MRLYELLIEIHSIERCRGNQIYLYTVKHPLYYLLHVSLNNNHYIYDKMKEAYVFHTMFPVPYHGLLHLDCRQLQLHLHPFGKLASR